MSAMPEKEPKKVHTDSKEAEEHVPKIDRNAPAGSENSLGAESVRDRRPATDDTTVEAMDEEGPGVTAPLADDKGSS